MTFVMLLLRRSRGQDHSSAGPRCSDSDARSDAGIGTACFARRPTDSPTGTARTASPRRLLEAMGAANSPCLGDRRSGVDRMEPAADIGIGGQRVVAAGQHETGSVNPAPAGYVGDRILVADDEFASCEMLIEHRVVALRLAAIAVDRIGQLFWGGALEVDRLAGKRPELGRPDIPKRPVTRSPRSPNLFSSDQEARACWAQRGHCSRRGCRPWCGG